MNVEPKNRHVCNPIQPPFPIMCDHCPQAAIVKCAASGMWLCKKHWKKHRESLALPLLTQPSEAG